MRLYLSAMGMAAATGMDREANAASLFRGSRDGLAARDGVLPRGPVIVGAIPGTLPPMPPGFSHFDSRNNRVLLAALHQIDRDVQTAIKRYGAARVAVVLGTSTSGIAEGEAAYAARIRDGSWPMDYRYTRQETGSGAMFLAEHLGLTGPAYVVATACSSSAKAFASARRLIRAGLCDAALVGGADTLCRLTLAGFSSLESVSATRCNPFSANRDGITIGEGGALFLMGPEPSDIEFLGIGESSDAHHVSAPDPEGKGALASMRSALADAGLSPGDIAYVNLHGTATPLNDSMESKAVHALFGERTLCSSTKALTGHTLGAAGAVEAAFLWLTLNPRYNPERLVPPHVWDGQADPALAPLAFASHNDRIPTGRRVRALSNSFAFGGSNASVILGGPE